MSDREVSARDDREKVTRVTVHACTSDARVLEIVTAKPEGSRGIADPKRWPTVTRGEIRQWRTEKMAAAEKAVADAALLTAMTSPGSKANAPTDLPPTATEAAAPGFTEPTGPAGPSLYGIMDDGLDITHVPGGYAAQSREGVTAPVTPAADPVPLPDDSIPF